jgi:hypothetical protein
VSMTAAPKSGRWPRNIDGGATPLSTDGGAQVACSRNWLTNTSAKLGEKTWRLARGRARISTVVVVAIDGRRPVRPNNLTTLTWGQIEGGPVPRLRQGVP